MFYWKQTLTVLTIAMTKSYFNVRQSYTITNLKIKNNFVLGIIKSAKNKQIKISIHFLYKTCGPSYNILLEVKNDKIYKNNIKTSLGLNII